MQASLWALGACVGLALGLTGAGGGIVAVPLLMFGAGLSLPQASPIALLAVGLAACVGTGLGLRDGLVRCRAAAVVGLAGMCVAPLGVWMAHRVPQPLLSLGLVLALLLSAWAMLLRSLASRLDPARREEPGGAGDARHGRFIWTWASARWFALVGLGAGVMSGLLGVGGGFFIVPALSRHANLPARSVIGTSQAVIALVSAAGVVGAIAQGGLAWDIAAPFCAAAMLAMGVARQVAMHLPAPWLQRGFAVLCVLAAVSVAWKLAAPSPLG